MTSSITVAGLYIHPLKSGRAVPCAELLFDELGAVHDRRWMLVDEAGALLTQREVPRLALIGPAVDIGSNDLTLAAPGMPPLTVGPSDYSKTSRSVRIWDDSLEALDGGNTAASWCSEVVGRSCRLVHIAPHAVRPLAPKYAGALSSIDRRVAFTDGAPLLLLSTASLNHLNDRLAGQGSPPLGMERFRPNIVLDGVAPNEEDSWLDIRIGSMRIGVGSTCPRCVLTTVDQSRGERDGDEPLRTLATYRRQNGKTMFGVNATHESPGQIALGDSVTVLQRK